MAFKCSWCGSLNTQAAFDTHQCLDCGQHTNANGSKDTPMQLGQTIDPFSGWVPTIEYPEPPEQHPDRRRRPGDILTDEYIAVETVQGPFAPPVEETPEPIEEPQPEPAPVSEPEPVMPEGN